MKSLFCSAVLLAAAIAAPAAASAAPLSGAQTSMEDGIPDGCFYVMGRLVCVDMPML